MIITSSNKHLLLLSYLIFLLTQSKYVQAQTPDSIASLLCTIEINEVKPSVKIQWDTRFNPQSYQVFRRNAFSGNFSLLANLDGSAINYEDEAIETGRLYEYRIVRNSALGQGTAFLAIGHNVPQSDNRGNVLILVRQYILDSLYSTFDLYTKALICDGWNIRTQTVSEQDNVASVRQLIQQANIQFGGQLRAIVLVGNIPVPYSGNMAPDGHVPDHQGAWPADGYYAAIDGFWSDSDVDIQTATRPENRNVPGDDKFDQNQYSTQVRFEIGRIDFSRLPAFEESEIALTRKYLKKNIAFRRGEIETQFRGIIQNNFASFPEGFGQSGLRNFAHLLGPQNTIYGNYRAELTQEPYMWSYGCGPGSYTSAAGIISTANLSTDSLQTIFTMLFGSYFGDWDTPNNLLRAALASGTVLTNAWAGRPVWTFHPMGMGQTIGFCTRMTQNNVNATYGTTFQRFTHSALMGDPTLHMYPLKPVESANADELQHGIQLTWYYPEDVIKQFNVYRKLQGEDVFSLLNNEPINGNTFIDSCHQTGVFTQYLIREIKLQETPTGSFYNLSHGYLLALTPVIENTPLASFEVETEELTARFINRSLRATSFHWNFGDGKTSSEEEPEHIYDEPGTYIVTLLAENDCEKDSLRVILEVKPNSVSNILKEECLRIFPNPTDNVLHLEWDKELPVSTLKLYDLQGKVQIQKRPNGVFQSNMDLSALPSGLYILKIESDKNSINRIVIKN